MDTATLFKELTSGINTLLKPHGYKKSGNNFRISHSENFGVINFQQSMSNSATEKKFTINIGIYSARIAKFMGRPSEIPSEPKCHYRERIGFLKPEKSDLWYPMTSSTRFENLLEIVRLDVIDLAVPLISERISDEGLRNLWLTEQTMQLTEILHLKYLSILLNEIGPREQLPAVLDKLRLNCSRSAWFQRDIDNHISKLTG
jgi:hypothetical protein